jgi:serine phosphatase RsbU (regulator of sigma subunit)/anti-sigma regulatory factor (Ser/Thr protein kinase)
MSTHPPPPERGLSNRVAFQCDFGAARDATRLLRDFLGEQGLDEAELFHCEVCLAEACNNAVQYAVAAEAPLVAEAVFNANGIELRVTDHTRGFELEDRAETIDPRRESGRGLFIIQSLMDEVRYFRGNGRNTLVMRKAHTRQHHRPEHDAAGATLEGLRRQLETCQQSISAMARELCVRSETLAAVFRCSAELGRTNDLEGFGMRLLGDLLHLTSADWFVVRLTHADASRLDVFAASEPALVRPSLPLTPPATAAAPLELSAAFSRRTFEFEPSALVAPGDPLAAAGAAASGLVQPLLFGEKLVGTLAIGRRASRRFSPLEIETIRTFAEFLAVQVINARQLEDQVNARIVAHELEIAHRIQRALLPPQLPEFPGCSLAASWQTARQVGGDFYDVLRLDDHTLLLVVADVMGKGVPAAMFATIMRSLLRALVGRGRQPAQLLRRLNELLYDELSSVGMFITVQLVAVDFAARTVTAASAGHCPVIVASGGLAQPLRIAGIPLGILPHPAFREESLPLQHPSALVLYTDGVTEAFAPDGRMYGTDRLLALVGERAGSARDAEALRDAMAADLAEFCSGEPLRDDQAFLVLLEEPVRVDGRNVLESEAAGSRPTSLAQETSLISFPS